MKFINRNILALTFILFYSSIIAQTWPILATDDQTGYYRISAFFGKIHPTGTDHFHEGIDIDCNNNNVYFGSPSSDITSDLKIYGGVIAHSVRATLNIPWYDNVFKPDYQLMSLKTLEDYIKTNHHLPDIPTQEEVSEKGIDLAEMNALLLKKVEELTLYVIELKKENELIKDRIKDINH